MLLKLITGLRLYFQHVSYRYQCYKFNYLFISDSYCQCAIRKFCKAIFSV